MTWLQLPYFLTKTTIGRTEGITGMLKRIRIYIRVLFSCYLFENLKVFHPRAIWIVLTTDSRCIKYVQLAIRLEMFIMSSLIVRSVLI